MHRFSNMVTFSVASAFFPSSLVAPEGRGMKPGRRVWQVKAANAKGPSKMINGTESLRGWSTLPDWSMLLAAITTIFSAVEKQWTNLEWKTKRAHLIDEQFGVDGQVFRRTFAIRSYEIGPDRSTSIVTVMNHLQVRRYRDCTLLKCTFWAVTFVLCSSGIQI